VRKRVVKEVAPGEPPSTGEAGGDVIVVFNVTDRTVKVLPQKRVKGRQGNSTRRAAGGGVESDRIVRDIMERLKASLATRGGKDVALSAGQFPVVSTEANISEDLNAVLVRATDVLGCRDEALRWMGTPVRALDFATPVSVLGTADGAYRVNAVLTRSSTVSGN
jgi:Protein of unknown function (DUF2384)